MRPAPGESSPLLLITALTAPLLHFLRFGYDHFSSDQDGFVALVMHRLNADLFGRDWFVQTLDAGPSVRDGVVLLLDILSRLVPLEWVLLILYAGSWIVLVTGVYVLLYNFSKSDVIACIATICTLVLTPYWTLGGNEFASRMFLPSMAAWGAALWGFVFSLRASPLKSGASLGAAALLQPLVGLQVMMIAALLAAALDGRKSVRHIGVLVATFVVVGGPLLVPLVIEQTGGWSAPGSDVDPMYVLAHFRAPHHYLFSAFPLESVLKFGVLVVAGTVSAFLAPVHNLPCRKEIRLLLGVVLSICLAAGVGSEVLGIGVITRAQLFKTTVLLKPVLIAAITAAVVALIVNRWRLVDEAKLRAMLAWTIYPVLTLWLATGVLLAVQENGMRELMHPLQRRLTDEGLAESWIREHTDVESVFVIPPSSTTFRCAAQRSVVVNFKSVPFTGEALLEWFGRMQAFAPVGRPERGGAILLDSLDRAFAELPPDRLAAAMRTYGADHLLRRSPFGPVSPDFVPVFESGDVRVYRFLPRESGP